MKPKILGIIPARLAATRLPNKPLIDLLGKTMIERVWIRANKSTLLHEVVIATPDSKIARVAEAFGGRAIMTSDSHRSGTDRLAEAATILKLDADDIVVNIQGDEPLLSPEGIDLAIDLLLQDPALPMSSLRCPCPEIDIDNPDCVKVVCALNGDALYFSRARLPFPRKTTGDDAVYQHCGLYAYRRSFLAIYASLEPSPLEKIESLEQLRVLENGYRIRMALVQDPPIGVDTPEDLQRVIDRLGVGR